MKLLTRKKINPPVQTLRQRLGDLVAIDTETTGLNPWKGGQPFAFSFASPEGETAYYEFPVDPFSREVMYKANQPAWDAIQELLADEGVEKVFWNAKFDVRMCRMVGFKVVGPIHEGMFAAHACNSDEMTFALKPMAKKYAGIGDEDQKELKAAVMRLRRKAKAAGWKIAEAGEADYWLPAAAWRCALVPPDEGQKVRKLCEKYATLDAERTIVLWMIHSKRMKKLNVRKVYDREMELWHVVYDMEERGVGINPKEVKALEVAYGRDRDDSWKQMTKIAGKFNPRSPQQMARILFDKLKLKLSPSGFRKNQSPRCTDFNALQELTVQHEFPALVLRHRSSTKALTFCEKYREMMMKDGAGFWAIHANFQQCGPKTGRFSCREPNMQQIPSKTTGRGKHPIDGRGPFGPRPGNTWFCIDYSQLEVRIYADQAEEETLLAVIASGQHVHSAITDHVWGGENDVCIKQAMIALFGTKGTSKDWDEVKVLRKKFWAGSEEKTAANWVKSHGWSIVKAEASLGKKNTVNKTKLMIFNQIYGGGVPSLIQLMEKPRQEVVEFVRYFDERIPGMRKWNAEITHQARKDGYVLTAYGRRIPVDKDHAYRAVNYRIQGSAADLMKRALVECNKYLRDNGVRAWIIMTIHDEIVFEFKRGEEKMRHVRKLKSIMEDHGGAFSIPMKAEVERVRKMWNAKEDVPWAK